MSKESAPRKSAMQRFVSGVEFVGNLLPHPFWLFGLLAILVLLFSYILSKSGTSVTYLAAKSGENPTEVTVAVQNLLTFRTMRAFLADFLSNYVGYASLGLVLTLMLGIGLIEQTGMVSALMRKTLLGAPAYLVTGALAVVGINANLASDAGIIFTPFIGAVIFKALGRNPWVGIVAGYAAASSGFTANFLPVGTDALLSGITQSAAESMQVPGPIHPLINWYFMIASTLTLTVVTVFVTEKFIVPIVGDNAAADAEDLKKHVLTSEENRGLLWALIVFVLLIAVLLVLTVPEGSFFRADNGDLVPRSPLLSSVVPILLTLFFSVGLAYGVGAGIIKSERDVPTLMAKGLTGNLGFLVVVLTASIFVYFFKASRLDTVIAVSGADYLEKINLNGLPLLVIFILLVALLNLFMPSGSAKWIILAPIFVPMLARMGFPPALTQLAYRVGDTSTNIISPLMAYMPVIIGLLEQYNPDPNRKVGMGTVISLAMPYSIAYIIVLTIQAMVWYALGLPIGPGTPVTM